VRGNLNWDNLKLLHRGELGEFMRSTVVAVNSSVLRRCEFEETGMTTSHAFLTALEGRS